MPTLAGGRQRQAQVTFFADTDQRNGAIDSRHAVGFHNAAFVQHVFQLRAPLPQGGRDNPGPAPAQGFLVLPKRQQKSARGLKPRNEQVFHCFELGQHAGFVVEGAAAVEVATGLLRGEGRPAPLVFGAGQHGHHVVVAHQQHRLQSRVAPRPRVEQAIAIEVFQLKLPMHPGKRLPNVAAKPAKLRRVRLSKIGGRNRGNSHRTD